MTLTVERGYFTPVTGEYARHEKRWSQYDMSAEKTDELFAPWTHIPIDTELLQLRQAFGSVNGFDGMGQGSRLVQWGVDCGAAVSLEFYEPKMQPVDHSRLTLLASDIMLPESWDIIRNYSPFHFMIYTPGDGSDWAWEQDDDPLASFMTLMDWSLSTIAPGGKLYYSDMYLFRPTIIQYISEQLFKFHTSGLHILVPTCRDGAPIARFIIQKRNDQRVLAETVPFRS